MLGNERLLSAQNALLEWGRDPKNIFGVGKEYFAFAESVAKAAEPLALLTKRVNLYYHTFFGNDFDFYWVEEMKTKQFFSIHREQGVLLFAQANCKKIEACWPLHDPMSGQLFIPQVFIIEVCHPTSFLLYVTSCIKSAPEDRHSQNLLKILIPYAKEIDNRFRNDEVTRTLHSLIKNAVPMLVCGEESSGPEREESSSTHSKDERSVSNAKENLKGASAIREGRMDPRRSSEENRRSSHPRGINEQLRAMQMTKPLSSPSQAGRSSSLPEQERSDWERRFSMLLHEDELASSTFWDEPKKNKSSSHPRREDEEVRMLEVVKPWSSQCQDTRRSILPDQERSNHEDSSSTHSETERTFEAAPSRHSSNRSPCCLLQ